MIRPVLIAVVIGLAGCVPCHKTPRVTVPLEQGRLSPSGEQLQKVDTVHTLTNKGATDEFEIVELQDEGFVGVAWDNKRYRVAYKDIRKLWVERPKWTFCPLNIR